jgi:hypothetical protein
MKAKFLLIGFALLCAVRASGQNNTLDLQGTWRFAIDRADAGESGRWYAKALEDRITLPGSMGENRKGDEITLETQWTGSIFDSTYYFNPRLAEYRTPDNIHIPFWLTPAKHYVGAAWYQRDVEVPADWGERHVTLFLERAHWETRVWINDREVGMQNSLSVPHVYDVGAYLRPGRNTITVRVDNRLKEINVGVNSHSVSDHTQGNWNGITGRIELQSRPKTHIADMQVYPDPAGKKAVVELSIAGTESGTVTLQAQSFNSDRNHRPGVVSAPFTPRRGTATVRVELPMGDDFLLWDEFEPNLYRLTASIETADGTDERQTRFGMRQFTIEGKWFYVNGRKTMLRGTVECCSFPLTGYPPMDVDSWVRIFEICRSYGLNHMRFHSYCPPAAALEAADLVGFYLQPEGPSWPNYTTSLGDGLPSDDYLWEEAHRIVREYGNSPSFCMFAIGNEPRGRNWIEWVGNFVDYWKEKDTRRVYTGASGWPGQTRTQFQVMQSARGLRWNERPESRSIYPAIANFDIPFVSHEAGQWCVFPDFTEIKKYTGVMRARNFELFREDLQNRNMGNLSSDFLMASGTLQALCYKNEIEKKLRTPGYAGFQLLSLNDFPGQGSAIIGVLNVFWEEKGYIDAEAFRRFCAPTVLLSRMEKFVFESDETLHADIEVSHFGAAPLSNVVTHWALKDAWGGTIASGELPARDLTIGECQQLGSVDIPLGFVDRAQKFNLEVSFDNGERVINDWDVWVYPAELTEPEMNGIYVTDVVDEQARAVLAEGGSVLLLLAGKVEQGKDVVQYMTPSFWNTSWFKMRPPHTEGALINDFHPVFRDFPTDFHSDIQWWELVQRAQVMELNNFPAEFQPIMQPIDTWFINRKLGMLFEARVGAGKILVCSADITSDPAGRPVARQLNYSIRKYMNSNLFLPEHTVDLSLIEDLSRAQGERLHILNINAPQDI